MVEYFDPGSWRPSRPGNSCAGGCDTCSAAAGSGGGAREADLGGEARLLVGAVARLREMGLGMAVDLLRGSR